MQIWLMLHIMAMFFAMALTVGPGITLTSIARTHDVRAIRAAYRATMPIFRIGGALMAVGVIFGIVAARTLGFPLGSSWLTMAYSLIVLWAALTAVSARRGAALGRAAEASPTDQPSPELVAAADNRLAAAAGPLAGLVWLAAVAVMVLKP